MNDGIGQRIKDKRIALKMTLIELGDRVGVGASTVRKWETGYIKDMRSDKIQKVAAALEVTPAYLMGWEVDPETVKRVSELLQNDTRTTITPPPMDGSFAPRMLQPKPSKEEIELVRIYNALSVRGRMTLLSTAMELEEKETEE